MIKTGYHIELLMPETMKLLGSIKSKITKYKNGENVSHLGITEVVVAHCNNYCNDYQNSYQQEFCVHLFLINCMA